MRGLYLLIGMLAGASAAAQPSFDARDFSGHWDRRSSIESFANTPGGTRGNELPGSREPPFTPAGRAAFDANKPGYGPRRAMQRNDPMGRCEPLGLVRNLVAEIVAPHATFEIVQTPTRILQLFEYRHDWREIWLDGRSLPTGDALYPKWNGFSVGRFEGDELVVDTIGMNDKSFVDNYRTPHTAQIHVVERFKLIDKGNALQVSATVEDPGAYNMPWTGVQRWNLGPRRDILEQVCAENSDEFFNYDVVPIPRAEKPDF